MSEILKRFSNETTISLIFEDNKIPNNIPREIPKIPIITPCIKKMDWIVILENPRDIKIAISFCLFKTSNDKDEIILNDVIAMISVSMINITLFSFPIAWNNALWVSVQLLLIIPCSVKRSFDVLTASRGSDNFNFI